MESPLLLPDGAGEVSGENLIAAEADGDDGPSVKGWKLFVRESRKLWSLAGPIACNLLFGYGISSAIHIFAGHLGTLQLTVISTAVSIIPTFASGILLGLGSAFETLSGQAFGAGQVEMLGVYLQRSWIILIVSALIMCPLYIYAIPILKLLGKNDDIAVLAGKFTVQITPQIFAMAINLPIQKFLQAQSKVSVLALCAFVALLLHVGLLWLFISIFNWGLDGAAAAYNISSWILCLAQLVYIVSGFTDGWNGLSWSAFKEIWLFARISLSSSLMLCLQSWYMMFLMIITSHLSNAEIAVGSVSICMNISFWEVMLLTGLNAAASVRVSNELGSGHPRAAKYSIIVVLFTSLTIGILCAGIVLATRNSFPTLFTKDKELQHEVANIAYFLAVNMILDGVQPALLGVVIGSGWQILVAYINLGCYYVLGFPLAYLNGCVFHWGVMGIWDGLVCGSALQTIILATIVWKTNWNQEALRASKRVEFWRGQYEAKKLQPCPELITDTNCEL